MKNDKQKKKSVKSSKKQNKYRALSLVLTSTLVIAPLTVPLSFYFPGGITASAAILDAEILSNIDSLNNSGTTTTNRWAADGSSKNVNFTISGGELVGGSVITSGRKQAVLAIPNELKGRVSLNGAAQVNTNVTITVSQLTFLTATLNAVDDLSEVLTQVADGLFGSLTGVNINLTTVNQKIDALNNIANFGSASFSSTPVLSADGSYISANIDDGLGLVLAQNLSTILQDLKAAISSLNATGTSIATNLIANAINVALSPVKLAANTAINIAIPLVGVGGAGVNQLADASVLGATSVNIPTTITSPQNLVQNLNAKFVGTVVKTDVIDVGLISTANGVSNIYYAGTAAVVAPPVVTNTTGTSQTGYTITGTATAGNTVDIRNVGGTTIGSGIVDGDGNFSITIPQGQATASEALNAVAKDGATESTFTPFSTPADPEVIAPPVVTNTTGTSQTGYTVTGTATAGNTIDIRNVGGTTIGSGTVDGDGNFSITIPQGQATANETLAATAKNGALESTATSFTTPADAVIVAPPVVTNTTGTSQTGYTVTGTSTAGDTIDIRNANGLTIGTGTTDGNGNFSVTIPEGQALANQALHAVAKVGVTESTPTSFSTPADPVTVDAPTINSVTGTSLAGHTVKGQAPIGSQVQISNSGGTIIGTTTTDNDGNFEITLPVGLTTANQDLSAVAIDENNNKSEPTSFVTPADPIAITAPTVNNVTGNSTSGYSVIGTATAGNTVEIRNTGGTVIGTTVADGNGNFTVILPVGSATPSQELAAIAKDEDNHQSPATTFTTPADPIVVTAPTVNTVIGNAASGYSITGTATAGDTVEIRNTGGTVIGSGITDPSGNFSITLPTGSATPNQQLNAVAKDGDGNTSNATPFITPSDPVVVASPTVQNVTGNSTSGYTITGTATAGNTVEIRNTGGTIIGNASVDESGNYTVVLPSGLATPSQQLAAIAKDGDGNLSSATPFTTPADPVVITAPIVDNVSGNSTSGYTVTGTATAGNIVEIKNTGGTVIGTTTADPNGDYTITIPIGSATPGQQLSVVAKDEDGNQSPATPFTTPADPVTVIAPTVNSVTGNSSSGYTVSGTATTGNTVEIRNTGGTVIGTGVSDSSGSYTIIIPIGLATPNQQLNAIAKDEDGNTSISTPFITPVDPVTVTSPTVDSVTGNSSSGYTISGTAPEGSTIEIKNSGGTVIGTGLADNNGNYTVMIPTGSANPNEQLSAIAKDGDGNTSPSTSFSTPADPVVVTSPTVDSVTGNSSSGYTITGTATAGNTVDIKNTGGTIIGTAIVDPSGNYTITLPAGAATPNQQLNAVTKDGDGNQSPATPFVTPSDPVTVVAPTVDSVTGNSSSGYAITGTATAGYTVEVKNTGGTILGTAIADGSGNFTITLPEGAATPNQQLSAITKDEDGNQSPATPFTTPADPVAVTAPIVNSVTGNSSSGYTVTGTATAGDTIEIRNTGGTVIGSSITDEGGNYTIVLPNGSAAPSQQLSAVAKDENGNQSPATPFLTPADPVVVTAPTVDTITGNSTDGYTVTGTAPENSLVEVRNTGGTVIGSGTTDSDGNYTATIPAGLANPNEQLTIVAKDEDGNTSPSTFFVTPADPVVITAPTVNTVVGDSTNGYTISGTAPADTTVEIKNSGGTIIGTGTADNNGEYTVTIPAGSASPNEELTVSAKDDNGNVSPGTSFITPADPVIITAPTVDTVTGNSSSGYTVSGVATAGNTVEIKNTGGTVLGNSIADDNGDYTVILPEGSATPNQQLSAVAKDNNGNQSPSTTFITPADPVNVTPPAITTVTGTSSTGYTVTGTATAGNTVEIRNTGGAILGITTVDPSGGFTIELPANSATPNQQLSAIAKDDNGNTSTATSFTTPADPTAITAPIVNNVTGNSESGYTVTGTAPAGSTIEIRNNAGTVIGSGLVDESGNFIIVISAGSASENEQLIAIAKDGSGNTSPGTSFVTPADPEVIVATPVISKITGNSLIGYTIFGRATPGNTVEIYNADNFLLGQSGVSEAGTFTITLPIGLAAANEQLSAIAKDSEENQSSPATFNLPADTSVDTISAPIVESVKGSSTTGYNVSGTADPQTTVNLYNPDGNKVGSGEVDENGDFDITILPEMVKPSEVDTAVARDANGNQSEATSFVIPTDPAAGNNGTDNSGSGNSGSGNSSNGNTAGNMSNASNGSSSNAGSQKNLPNNGESGNHLGLLGTILLGALAIFGFSRKSKKEDK